MQLMFMATAWMSDLFSPILQLFFGPYFGFFSFKLNELSAAEDSTRTDKLQDAK